MRQTRRDSEGPSRRRAGHRQAGPHRAGHRSAWAGVLLAVAATAGGGAALAGAAGTAAPAGADPITDCSTTTGVVVVVDFSHFGGTVDRGCAASPATGLDALHAAGFTTAGTTEYGAAFVCRIDTLPTPTQTPCTSTPPTSAYWANWYAEPGQTTWSYAQLGAESYTPPPGSVTAWVFGSTTGGAGSGRPSFTPTQVRATNPGPTGGGGGSTPTTTPPTTAPPTTAPGPAPTASTATTAPGGGQSAPPGGRSGTRSTTPPGGTSAHSGGSGSTTTTSGTGSGTTSTTGAGTGSEGGGAGGSGGSGGSGGGGGKSGGSHPRIVDVQPASARLHPSSGSPLALALGAVVAAVLAGAAGAVAWRRRRAGRAA